MKYRREREIMANYSRKHRLEEASHDEAMRIARGTQTPGQTKEQTRLIAKGIQKGIEQYRKQHNARDRELEKRRKKSGQQSTSTATGETEIQVREVYRQHWLPWVLLIFSWLAMAACWLLYM